MDDYILNGRNNTRTVLVVQTRNGTSSKRLAGGSFVYIEAAYNRIGSQGTRSHFRHCRIPRIPDELDAETLVLGVLRLNMSSLSLRGVKRHRSLRKGRQDMVGSWKAKASFRVKQRSISTHLTPLVGGRLASNPEQGPRRCTALARPGYLNSSYCEHRCLDAQSLLTQKPHHEPHMR